MELLSSLHLPAQAGRQSVWVDLNLIGQLPALVKQLLPLGQRSPRLLRFLVLPRPQREESPWIFITPNQHEGHSPWGVTQSRLGKGTPPLDELLLALCPNQPFARAVGLSCLLHPFLSSFHPPHGPAGVEPFQPLSIMAATSVRSELLRIPLPRTLVNKDKDRKGRGW